MINELLNNNLEIPRSWFWIIPYGCMDEWHIAICDDCLGRDNPGTDPWMLMLVIPCAYYNSVQTEPRRDEYWPIAHRLK